VLSPKPCCKLSLMNCFLWVNESFELPGMEGEDEPTPELLVQNIDKEHRSYAIKVERKELEELRPRLHSEIFSIDEHWIPK
jgi:hypothetical protein